MPTEQPASPAPEKVEETPKKAISTVPSDEKLIAALGYIPMLFVGPLIMKPKSVFCQVHGKQGLLITIITFVTLFLLALIPAIGSLLFLGLIGLIAISAFQAYSGVEWKVPVLYDIAQKINVDALFAGTTVKPVATPPAAAAPTTETPSTPSTSSEPKQS